MGFNQQCLYIISLIQNAFLNSVLSIAQTLSWTKILNSFLICALSAYMYLLKLKGSEIPLWMKFSAWMNLCSNWCFKIYFFFTGWSIFSAIQLEFDGLHLNMFTLFYSMNLNACYVSKWLCWQARETIAMCNQVKYIDHVYQTYYMSSLYVCPPKIKSLYVNPSKTWWIHLSWHIGQLCLRIISFVWQNENLSQFSNVLLSHNTLNSVLPDFLVAFL